MRLRVCVRERERVCVCVCVRAGVRTCIHVSVYVYVRAHARVCDREREGGGRGRGRGRWSRTYLGEVNTRVKPQQFSSWPFVTEGNTVCGIALPTQRKSHSADKWSDWATSLPV